MDIIAGITLSDFFLVVLAGLISFIVAHKYGDKAGTEAAIKYEKEKEKEAYTTLLYALHNQATVAESIVRGYKKAHVATNKNTTPVVKMPTLPFEIAFVTDKNSSMATNTFLDSASTKTTINDIASYLVLAYSANALVDSYMSLIPTNHNYYIQIRQEIVSGLAERSEEISIVLTKLKKTLSDDIEKIATLGDKKS